MHSHALPTDQPNLSLDALVGFVFDPQIEEMSRIFHSLSDPTRCRIVVALLNGERCVTELAELLKVSLSGVSHHLKELRDRQIVSTRRAGNTIYYAVEDTHMTDLLRAALFHLDHVEQGLADHNKEAIKSA